MPSRARSRALRCLGLHADPDERPGRCRLCIAYRRMRIRYTQFCGAFICQRKQSANPPATASLVICGSARRPSLLQRCMAVLDLRLFARCSGTISRKISRPAQPAAAVGRCLRAATRIRVIESSLTLVQTGVFSCFVSRFWSHSIRARRSTMRLNRIPIASHRGR